MNSETYKAVTLIKNNEELFFLSTGVTTRGMFEAILVEGMAQLGVTQDYIEFARVDWNELISTFKEL